jgi:hypothetical protein
MSFEEAIPTRVGVCEGDCPEYEMTISYVDGSSFVDVTINGQEVHLDYRGVIEAMTALGMGARLL